MIVLDYVNNDGEKLEFKNVTKSLDRSRIPGVSFTINDLITFSDEIIIWVCYDKGGKVKIIPLMNLDKAHKNIYTVIGSNDKITIKPGYIIEDECFKKYMETQKFEVKKVEKTNILKFFEQYGTGTLKQLTTEDVPLSQDVKEEKTFIKSLNRVGTCPQILNNILGAYTNKINSKTKSFAF